jgi:microcompartment protein CcmK/EutM
MNLARVIGTVVATQKEARLSGSKLLLLAPADTAGKALVQALPVVAVDAVGAGLHDVVLYAEGSSARQTDDTRDTSVDAVVMAIVDLIEHTGTPGYRK